MLLEVSSHVFDIPERLKEVDPQLRVLFNTDRQQYEVWGRDLYGPYMLVAFKELDQRALTAVRYGYWVARNTGWPYKHLLQKQADIDYRAEQARYQKLREIEYGLQDDLRFMGRPVIQGAAF
ncbi:hypothetical protein [Gelria sp. Kuro-4]|uniref:hypothetical protein n=1 Tax=Gelria sp. Kuro-4 TaxID=2796927 RepID=UPI001BEE5544|nr:hypothetical protein [Gelria sp. Kuro-4]BCV23298.1 hypothetical protein kuro4_00710 [Gelria sp. Kuro-4]